MKPSSILAAVVPWLLQLRISSAAFLTSPSTRSSWTRVLISQQQQQSSICLSAEATSEKSSAVIDAPSSPQQEQQSSSSSPQKQQQQQQQPSSSSSSAPNNTSWLLTTDPERRQQDAFYALACGAATCLFASDQRRDALHEEEGQSASGGPTNWIDTASAAQLETVFDQVDLRLPGDRSGNDRDEAAAWLRWIKAVPCPAIIDFSTEFHQIVNEIITDRELQFIAETRDNFLRRLGCRLIVFPSGAPLATPLSEPPSSLFYGKILYGGVQRYKLLSSSSTGRSGGGGGGGRPPRRAGVRTAIKTRAQDRIPSWMMYGGPERMYEAEDMGPAAVLEVLLLPRGRIMEHAYVNSMGRNMVIRGLVWKPSNMLHFVSSSANGTAVNGATDAGPAEIQTSKSGSLSGKNRNDAFQSDFQTSVGGLRPQIEAIIRRVLDGRIITPAEDADRLQAAASAKSKSSSSPQQHAIDDTSRDLSIASLEAEELALLGLTPVRGLLLYGPPGCGKTALAREISRALKARAPKIVAAPELLDRWVGGSEKAVRALFTDAEAELAACNGDAAKSALHVIVIDEIDAVFRKRSSAEDTGEATRSSVVNQILSKLDGVNAIPNVLLIGLTNRRELLDEALLRPGRLEVQVEIPLPDVEGRREILKIHFAALRKKGRLSQPLCHAIDGVSSPRAANDTEPFNNSTSDATATTTADTTSRRQRLRQSLRRSVRQAAGVFPPVLHSSFDLAADYATGGYSGADLAGLVRCAGSLALARTRKDGSGIDGLLITLDDVKQSLKEMR